MNDLTIRPFQPTDQVQARAIVLAGLGSRWGHIDYSLNPDLDDIQANYIDKGYHFFVAEVAGEMVGTCALTFDELRVGRIERMSVKAVWQRKGFARKLTNHLIQTARDCGCHTLNVETDTPWTSAVRLYQSCGFQLLFENDGETHMQMRL